MYRIIGADGQIYGPVSADQLRRWIAEGRANAETRTLAEGSAEWKPLGTLPGFLTPPVEAGRAQSNLGAGPVAPLRYRRETNTLAISGLILGIFSCTIGICCCYGLPFNLLGLIFSLMAMLQIDRHPEWYEGKGLAIAGLILSAFSLVLAFLLLLVFGTLSIWGEPGHHVYRL
jgi:hypothetical protein